MSSSGRRRICEALAYSNLELCASDLWKDAPPDKLNIVYRRIWLRALELAYLLNQHSLMSALITDAQDLSAWDDEDDVKFTDEEDEGSLHNDDDDENLMLLSCINRLNIMSDFVDFDDDFEANETLCSRLVLNYGCSLDKTALPSESRRNKESTCVSCASQIRIDCSDLTSETFYSYSLNDLNKNNNCTCGYEKSKNCLSSKTTEYLNHQGWLSDCNANNNNLESRSESSTSVKHCDSLLSKTEPGDVSLTRTSSTCGGGFRQSFLCVTDILQAKKDLINLLRKLRSQDKTRNRSNTRGSIEPYLGLKKLTSNILLSSHSNSNVKINSEHSTGILDSSDQLDLDRDLTLKTSESHVNKEVKITREQVENKEVNEKDNSKVILHQVQGTADTEDRKPQKDQNIKSASSPSADKNFHSIVWNYTYRNISNVGNSKSDPDICNGAKPDAHSTVSFTSSSYFSTKNKFAALSCNLKVANSQEKRFNVDSDVTALTSQTSSGAQGDKKSREAGPGPMRKPYVIPRPVRHRRGYRSKRIVALLKERWKLALALVQTSNNVVPSTSSSVIQSSSVEDKISTVNSSLDSIILLSFPNSLSAQSRNIDTSSTSLSHNSTSLFTRHGILDKNKSNMAAPFNARKTDNTVYTQCYKTPLISSGIRTRDQCIDSQNFLPKNKVFSSNNIYENKNNAEWERILNTSTTCITDGIRSYNKANPSENTRNDEIYTNPHQCDDIVRVSSIGNKTSSSQTIFNKMHNSIYNIDSGCVHFNEKPTESCYPSYTKAISANSVNSFLEKVSTDKDILNTENTCIYKSEMPNNSRSAPNTEYIYNSGHLSSLFCTSLLSAQKHKQDLKILTKNDKINSRDYIEKKVEKSSSFTSDLESEFSLLRPHCIVLLENNSDESSWKKQRTDSRQNILRNSENFEPLIKSKSDIDKADPTSIPSDSSLGSKCVADLLESYQAVRGLTKLRKEFWCVRNSGNLKSSVKSTQNGSRKGGGPFYSYRSRESRGGRMWRHSLSRRHRSLDKRNNEIVENDQVFIRSDFKEQEQEDVEIGEPWQGENSDYSEDKELNSPRDGSTVAENLISTPSTNHRYKESSSSQLQTLVFTKKKHTTIHPDKIYCTGSVLNLDNDTGAYQSKCANSSPCVISSTIAEPSTYCRTAFNSSIIDTTVESNTLKINSVKPNFIENEFNSLSKVSVASLHPAGVSIKEEQRKPAARDKYLSADDVRSEVRISSSAAFQLKQEALVDSKEVRTHHLDEKRVCHNTKDLSTNHSMVAPLISTKADFSSNSQSYSANKNINSTAPQGYAIMTSLSYHPDITDKQEQPDKLSGQSTRACINSFLPSACTGMLTTTTSSDYYKSKNSAEGNNKILASSSNTAAPQIFYAGYTGIRPVPVSVEIVSMTHSSISGQGKGQGQGTYFYNRSSYYQPNQSGYFYLPVYKPACSLSNGNIYFSPLTSNSSAFSSCHEFQASNFVPSDSKSSLNCLEMSAACNSTCMLGEPNVSSSKSNNEWCTAFTESIASYPGNVTSYPGSIAPYPSSITTYSGSFTSFSESTNLYPGSTALNSGNFTTLNGNSMPSVETTTTDVTSIVCCGHQVSNDAAEKTTYSCQGHLTSNSQIETTKVLWQNLSSYNYAITSSNFKYQHVSSSNFCKTTYVDIKSAETEHLNQVTSAPSNLSIVSMSSLINVGSCSCEINTQSFVSVKTTPETDLEKFPSVEKFPSQNVIQTSHNNLPPTFSFLPNNPAQSTNTLITGLHAAPPFQFFHPSFPAYSPLLGSVNIVPQFTPNMFQPMISILPRVGVMPSIYPQGICKNMENPVGISTIQGLHTPISLSNQPTILLNPRNPGLMPPLPPTGSVMTYLSNPFMQGSQCFPW